MCCGAAIRSGGDRKRQSWVVREIPESRLELVGAGRLTVTLVRISLWEVEAEKVELV